MATAQPNMQNFLREWRQDALNKAQYESAIFIGDKLLAMTSEGTLSLPPCDQNPGV
jgi:anaphase-promoting complex subunit 6